MPKPIYGVCNGKNIYTKNTCDYIDYMIVQETNNMELDNLYKECSIECDKLKDIIKDLENKLATKMGTKTTFNVTSTAVINWRYILYIKKFGVPINWVFDPIILNSLERETNVCPCPS